MRDLVYLALPWVENINLLCGMLIHFNLTKLENFFLHFNIPQHGVLRYFALSGLGILVHTNMKIWGMIKYVSHHQLNYSSKKMPVNLITKSIVVIQHFFKLLYFIFLFFNFIFHGRTLCFS